jgi:hypothetical protein
MSSHRDQKKSCERSENVGSLSDVKSRLPRLAAKWVPFLFLLMKEGHWTFQPLPRPTSRHHLMDNDVLVIVATTRNYYLPCRVRPNRTPELFTSRSSNPACGLQRLWDPRSTLDLADHHISVSPPPPPPNVQSSRRPAPGPEKDERPTTSYRLIALELPHRRINRRPQQDRHGINTRLVALVVTVPPNGSVTFQLW